MAPIPKLVSGLVKALKKRSNKANTAEKREQSENSSSANRPSPDQAIETDLLQGSPFPISMYIDKFFTVLRVKIPEENYEKTVKALIQKGDLLDEIKKIFLFQSLGDPVR